MRRVGSCLSGENDPSVRSYFEIWLIIARDGRAVERVSVINVHGDAKVSTRGRKFRCEFSISFLVKSRYEAVTASQMGIYLGFTKTLAKH